VERLADIGLDHGRIDPRRPRAEARLALRLLDHRPGDLLHHAHADDRQYLVPQGLCSTCPPTNVGINTSNKSENLRDQHQISRRQAAYALLDLHSPSTRLIGASLLEAVAVSVGVSRTPGGLQIAA
jgi:hypothetical protein